MNKNVVNKIKLFVDQYEICIESEQYLKGYVKNCRIKELESNGILLPNYDIIDVENQINSLGSIIKRPTLILRIFDSNCADCIINEINLIRDLYVDNVIILVNNFTVPLKDLFDKYYFNYTVYNISKLDIPVEILEKPYMFILNEDLICLNVFVPILEFQNLSKTYLHSLYNILNQK